MVKCEERKENPFCSVWSSLVQNLAQDPLSYVDAWFGSVGLPGRSKCTNSACAILPTLTSAHVVTKLCRFQHVLKPCVHLMLGNKPKMKHPRPPAQRVSDLGTSTGTSLKLCSHGAQTKDRKSHRGGHGLAESQNSALVT